MPDRADQLADAIGAYLREQMSVSPAACNLAIELANWIIQETDHAERPAPATASDQSKPAAAPQPDPVPAASQQRSTVPLDLGGTKLQIEVPGTSRDFAAAHESATTSSRAGASASSKPANCSAAGPSSSSAASPAPMPFGALQTHLNSSRPTGSGSRSTAPVPA